MGSDKRLREEQIKIRVSFEEKEKIHQNAERCGLTLAPFLRNVGMGYEVRGVVDERAVLELVKLRADIGRLGGLLKMWLGNDERFSEWAAVSRGNIRTLLDEIENTHQVLKKKILEI